MLDSAVSPSSYAKSMTFPARLYTKLRKYRLKDATDALQGLAQMAGDPQCDNPTRENNLNWLCISYRLLTTCRATKFNLFWRKLGKPATQNEETQPATAERCSCI